MGFVCFRTLRTLSQRKRIPREILAAAGKTLPGHTFEIEGLRFEIELARSAMMDSVAGNTGVVIVCFVETGTSAVISTGTSDGTNSKSITWLTLDTKQPAEQAFPHSGNVSRRDTVSCQGLKNEGSGAFVYSEFPETATSFSKEFRGAALDAIESGWKAVEIRWLGINFWTECPSFDKALLDSAVRLCRLASEKILAPGKFSGLKVTVRTGFEKDIPQIHWTKEQLALVPPNFTRVCVSAHDSVPYLNAPLCELLRMLAAGRDAYHVCRGFPFADVFADSGLVGTRLLPVSTRDSFIYGLDRFTEGEVIDSFISVCDSGTVVSQIQKAESYNLHSAIIRNLSGVELYCRRLLEYDSSWYTGEYEILTTHSEAKVLEAVNAVAAKYSCSVERIEAPFRKKITQIS